VSTTLDSILLNGIIIFIPSLTTWAYQKFINTSNPNFEFMGKVSAHSATYTKAIKVKVNRITGAWGPEGCGRLRFPDSVTSALECGMLSVLRTGRLYPQE
jgi:hypothetical protein